MAFQRVVGYAPHVFAATNNSASLLRAFINRPKILFADEPAGNLGSQKSQSVIEIMLELNVKLKTALVLVTHDPDVARPNGAHDPAAKRRDVVRLSYVLSRRPQGRALSKAPHGGLETAAPWLTWQTAIV